MAPIKAMRPYQAFGVAGLVIGGGFLLFSSTFRTQLTCEFNRAEMSIIPIREKHPSWPLTALFGVGMIGVGAWQLKEMGEEESGSSQHLLAHSNAAPFIPNQASSGLRTVMPELVLYSPNQAFTNQSEAVYTQLEPNSGWSEPVLDQINQQTQPQQDLISALAASPLSLIDAAPPGTGKTTLLLGLIGKTFEKYPDAQFFICGWKHDDFCGLSDVPGVLELIDGTDFTPLTTQVEKVKNILRERSRMPKEQRKSLSKLPVRLVLDDFYSTLNVLGSSAKFKPIYEELKANLGYIQTIGREFNVAVWIFTHSFNIAAAGFSDSNIRGCLNVCGHGKVSKNEDGREDGGFGAISKIIKNSYVVDDPEVRDNLINELPKLQEASDLHGVPVFFTTMGHPPKLTLLPNMAWVESFRLPQEILQRLGDKVKALNPQPQVQQAFTALPAFTEPKFNQERFPSVTEVLENPQDKVSSDSDDSFYSLPEMSEEAEKVLFGVVWREMENGKSKSSIITETLGCKGRNYQKGQQWYEHLLNKYKP